tara:strand:- start:559 stop:825 length:267 start_codon:yes stop_codon:yes gene_type:complete
MPRGGIQPDAYYNDGEFAKIWKASSSYDEVNKALYGSSDHPQALTKQSLYKRVRDLEAKYGIELGRFKTRKSRFVSVSRKEMLAILKN